MAHGSNGQGRRYLSHRGVDVSIAKQSQPIHQITKCLLNQIALDGVSDIVGSRERADVFYSDPAHFLLSLRHDAGILLLVMDAEAGEKARQPFEAKSRPLRSQQKVPVECKAESFVDRAHALPDAAAPK